MSKLITASRYCGSVFDGTHDTPKPVKQGKLLITSKHISGGTLDVSTAYMISEEDYASIQKRSAVSRWDILFSMIGSVGEVYLEKNEKIPYAIKNIGVFSCESENKAKWLYYYLRSPSAKSHINRYLNGAVQKFLPLGALRDFPVIPFDDQKASLVKVLEILDAKIECNNCINTELEEMGKTLYDYWFVQFDFPDANGKPYKSSGGKMVYNPTLKKEIPAGWRHSTIGETFKTHLGGTPSREKKEYWTPSEVNWLSSGENPSTFVVEPDERISNLGLQNSPAKLLPEGTVILSIVRHLRASILGIEAATNQSVVGIVESSAFKHCFIYPYLVREIPRLMVLRTGAQQPHINKGVLDECLLVVPDESTLEAYTSLAAPLFLQIKNYHQQNRELTQLRDWLLPMLMNGQVTVA
ncbi:MAG: restriction endonuclease subunit S [Betaproteobacteria bacterium]|nr:restriction endonuclease subunit S [Betaproteobacteria bacterium]